MKPNSSSFQFQFICFSNWHIVYILTLNSIISALCISVHIFSQVLCIMKMWELWKWLHADKFNSSCASGQEVKHTKQLHVISLIPNITMFLLLIVLAASASIYHFWYKLSNTETEPVCLVKSNFRTPFRLPKSYEGRQFFQVLFFFLLHPFFPPFAIENLFPSHRHDLTGNLWEAALC